MTGENRLYGWSKRGEPAEITRNNHGDRMSVIGALALDGIRTHMTYEGTLDTEKMLAFMSDLLLPALRPGDIVVMDGLSVHKSPSVLKLFAERKIEVVILPAYSPELNPIEHTWSTLKARIRAVGCRTLEGLAELIHKFLPELGVMAEGWIRHCGYVIST